MDLPCIHKLVSRIIFQMRFFHIVMFLCVGKECLVRKRTDIFKGIRYSSGPSGSCLFRNEFFYKVHAKIKTSIENPFHLSIQLLLALCFGVISKLHALKLRGGSRNVFQNGAKGAVKLLQRRINNFSLCLEKGLCVQCCKSMQSF